MKEALDFAIRLLGRCSRKSRDLWDVSVVALAVVAQQLLDSCPSLVEDIRRLKDNKFRRVEAETLALEADAQRKYAAAAQAANTVTEREFERAVRELELEKQAIRNRKLAAEAAAAEARADKSKAEAARAEIKACEALMEVYKEARQKNSEAAEEELLDALRQYNLEGGILHIDSENLRSLIKLTKPATSTVKSKP
jgi:hypothetical protein